MIKPDIKNDLDIVEDKSMSDKLINVYLPGCRTITYSDLYKYDSIEELLPSDKTYFILLYARYQLQSEVSGHWTCVTRLNNEISYFDSYGKPPDYAIDHWFKDNEKQQTKFLSSMFNKTKMNVFYNDVAYQDSQNDIATCGRHCIWYILNMKKGKDLNEYYEFMKGIKQKTKMNYDQLVSFFVNLI